MEIQKKIKLFKDYSTISIFILNKPESYSDRQHFAMHIFVILSLYCCHSLLQYEQKQSFSFYRLIVVALTSDLI